MKAMQRFFQRHAKALAARAVLMLGLVASGAAWAACNVTLVSVSGNQALLQANCEGAAITGITWRRDGISLNGGTDLLVASTAQPIHYTTTLISGTHSYTASGNGGVVATGTAATITAGDPSLTVAVVLASGTSGTVTSTPAGISCTSGSCTASFAMDSAVSLAAVPTPNTNSYFGSWGGDCSGTGLTCVVAMNGARTVIASFTSAPPTLPGAPTIGTASLTIPASANTPSSQVASVTFTPPLNNGGSAITGYTVTSSPGGLIGSGSGTPITVSGLAYGTPYTFTVAAINSVGPGPASLASNSVTPTNFPGAPTIGTATAGNTSATVAFTPPASNGGSAITGYTATSNPGGFTGTGAASPITVSGLTNGTAYTFTVTATNSVVGTGQASAPSNSVTPNTVTVPGAPTGVTATAGNAQAAVSFAAPASNGGPTITGYTVTSNPAGGVDSNAGTTALSHAITNLTNGTAYTFTVTATNSAGTSAPSSPSNSVTPTGPPPTPPTSCTVIDVAQQYPGWPAGEGSGGGQPLLSHSPGEMKTYKVAASVLLPPNLASLGGTTSFVGYSNYSGSAGTVIEVSNQPCALTASPNLPLTCQRTGADAFTPRFFALGPNTDPATRDFYNTYGFCNMPQPANDTINGVANTPTYYINVKVPSVNCNQGSTCQFFLSFWRL